MAVLALSLLAFVSVPVVHEAGHALAALLVGGRGLRLVWRGRLSFALSAELPDSARRRRTFYAGGPLANLIVAAVIAAAAHALVDEPVLLVSAFGAAFAHAVFGLVNLLPLAGHDGRALFSRAGERD